MGKIGITKRPIYLLVIMLLLSANSFISGCNKDSIPTSTISSDSMSGINSSSSIRSNDSAGSGSDISNPDLTMQFQMISIHDKILLIPSASSFSYTLFKDSAFSYILDDDKGEWIPAKYSVKKTDSITGRSFREDLDSTFDIYQVKFGNFIGYVLQNTEEFVESIEENIIWRLSQGQQIIQPQSKDFTIIKAFDDIYSVDSTGKTRMISSRNIGSFNYATINKQGIGDLYPWVWTDNPVCNQVNNTIYFLSAREGKFYSIWELNLDKGTEKRFGNDIVTLLAGTGADKLIAKMNPESSDIYAKLISTSNPLTFTQMGQDMWNTINNWLFIVKGTNLILENNKIHIEVDAGRIFTPLRIDSKKIWLFNKYSQTDCEYMVIDLINSKYSLQTTSTDNTAEDWQKFLKSNKTNMISFKDAQSNGIKILLK